MQSLRQFITRHEIESETDYAEDNPNARGFVAGSRHFVVTLKVLGESMEVPFSQGPLVDGEPDAEQVLDCLASDISLLEQEGDGDGVKMAVAIGETIETTDDVEQAQRTARVITEHREGLERLLGGAGPVEELLYETERL